MPPGLDAAAYSPGLLPGQLPAFGHASVQPEKRLLLAVLEEAVRSWQRTPAGNGANGRRRRELLDWFASDDTGWPCAFASICDQLGIDRSWARERLGVRPCGEPETDVFPGIELPVPMARAS